MSFSLVLLYIYISVADLRETQNKVTAKEKFIYTMQKQILDEMENLFYSIQNFVKNFRLSKLIFKKILSNLLKSYIQNAGHHECNKKQGHR